MQRAVVPLGLTRAVPLATPSSLPSGYQTPFTYIIYFLTSHLLLLGHGALNFPPSRNAADRFLPAFRDGLFELLVLLDRWNPSDWLKG